MSSAKLLWRTLKRGVGYVLSLVSHPSHPGLRSCIIHYHQVPLFLTHNGIMALFFSLTRSDELTAYSSLQLLTTLTNSYSFLYLITSH